MILSRNGVIQRVATTTSASEVSSVRTATGIVASNAGGSSKRSNGGGGGGNFVSLGGVSKTVAGATTDSASLKQSSLPVNSSANLGH